MREFTWKESNSFERICAAVEAKAASIETFDEDDPPDWREFGEREVDAWFLTNFAYFYSRQNASYADIAERLRWAHALRGLHQIASKYNIAVMVVHHQRKADADDSLDTAPVSPVLRTPP